MMNSEIKIAILGYGHIGKKHAAILSSNAHFKIVALIDVKFSAQASPTLDGIPVFESLELFLNSNLEVDIIAICTPNGLHYKQSRLIIEQGINLIIEKPITLNSDEALALGNLAAEKGVHLFPVMQNRFSPPALWLKEIVESEILGNIFLVQVSCYWNRNEHYYEKDSWRGTKSLDGGTLYTQFSHYLDMLYWLFGDITNIKSKFADFNHSHLTEFEDSGIVTFDFANGGMGSFNFSTSVWSENLESSMTVIAENGSVKIGGQYMNNVEKCLIKNYTQPHIAETSLPNDYGSFKGSAQNHQFLYKNIVDFFQNGYPVKTTTQESIEVLKMIENIYQGNQ